MSVINKGSQEFEPYARLMNIIGDQLITDKKVAVIEIIKNCYDADATNVDVRFFNLDNSNSEDAYIEIEDDGEGMSLDIIKNVWLRPATPNKFDKKQRDNNYTKKGRILQGEKGVGRFAIHKLGETIEIYTKANKDKEVKLELDFAEYNPESSNSKAAKEFKLLKEVKNRWSVSEPAIEIKKAHGTLIRITNIREEWQERDYKGLYKAISKLLPPVDPNSEKFNVELASDFNVRLFIDDEEYVDESSTTIESVMERAPFKMFGSIDANGVIEFQYVSSLTNRKCKRTFSLFNEDKAVEYGYNLWAYKEWFSKLDRKPKCGPIDFSFYAYDLANRDKTVITNEIRDFMKENFVYVFRDAVRVYPFGEKEYDWLDLDKLRAVVKAGAFPSYNDLTGFIYISQDHNKLLKDSTNRQGMMNIAGAYDDFKYFVLAAAEILNTESKIDKEKRKVEKSRSFLESNKILKNSFNAFKKSLDKIDDSEVLQKANKFLEDVEKHTDVIKDRMETVEDLAGLGMAVEKSSHDSLMLLSRMKANLNSFKKVAKRGTVVNDEFIGFINELEENLSFVYDELQIIQPLFKIQRKVTKDISLAESIQKVISYFRRDLEGIEVNVIADKDIIIRTNQGLVLQLIINLLDNAIYWVNRGTQKKKVISFKIDTKYQKLTIADNGPGIREDVIPVVFNEFFSLKANGRGLGLYIVKEILLRINADISVVENENQKILPGANFIIEFNNDK